MDKTIYQIIKQSWLFIKLYIQNANNSNKESYWDGVSETMRLIVDSTEGQPEYVSKFAYDIVMAAYSLLVAMYREKKGAKHEQIVS